MAVGCGGDLLLVVVVIGCGWVGLPGFIWKKGTQYIEEPAPIVAVCWDLVGCEDVGFGTSAYKRRKIFTRVIRIPLVGKIQSIERGNP